MPVVKATLHTAMPPTVHVLKPPQSSVLPPADWALDGKYGHMAFEAGDAGRLVRLAEVLRWLQSSRGLPRTDALKLLCDGLSVEVMGSLYWLVLTNWAVPVSPTHTFGFMTTEQIAASEERVRQQQYQAWLRQQRQNNSFGTSFNRFGAALTMQNGQISTKHAEPVEPGLPALLKYLRGWWVVSTRRGTTCDVLDDLKIRHATTLAIRLDKAYEVWGYGSVANAPLSAEKQPASAEWTGERLAAQRAVFVAAGNRDFTKRLAALSGLEEREIRRLIGEFNASKTDVKPQTVWPSQIIKKR